MAGVLRGRRVVVVVLADVLVFAGDRAADDEAGGAVMGDHWLQQDRAGSEGEERDLHVRTDEGVYVLGCLCASWRWLCI